jgi:GH35 family endo-1,4-beta-xylanase
MGVLFACVTPLLALACSSTHEAPDVEEGLGVAREAISDCGYSVVTEINSVKKTGFNAKITVTNVNGATSTGFNVLVNSGSAQLRHVAHGDFQTNEYGYLIVPNGSIAISQLNPGQSYNFELQFDGTYTQLTSFMQSNGGTACDLTAPTINLDVSGALFTSDGTLTLSASATDDVAVGKVVFMQDDVPVGEVRTAPYTLTVPVTSDLNGRHRYTATAYDLAGNQTGVTKRVLVAINNKFFGTAATTAADYSSLTPHFNQITPGNAGKWGSVEAVRDQMNWTELDTAYHFAKANHIPFKLHTLVWGQQQPSWLASLTPEQQLAEIDQWMAALAARYPQVELVDVVNEPLHAPPAYATALGGAGATGWDWVITSFQMARKYFPNSELILNDYSILTMASTTQSYANIVNLLNDRGLIDGIGEQGHFYERAPELEVLSANLNTLVATGLPIYITELDLNFADDAQQANRMKDLFTTLWSIPSVLGVTHWGYLQGNMWQTNAYLVNSNGTSRPALTWIECYRSGGTNCTVPVYVPQPRQGDNTVISLEAEEYDSAHALLPAGNVVAYANDGSWLGFSRVTFNNNWDTLSVAYALGGTTGINLSVHLGSESNPPVATIPLSPTGSWSTTKTVSIPWAPIGTVNDVVIRFNGGGANVDKIQFSAPSGTGTNLIADSDFESGTIDGWSTWATGTLSNSTSRAVSGTHSLVMTGRNGNSPLVQSLTGKVLPGKTYKASVWASIGGASASAYVTTALQCANGSTTYGRLGGWSNAQTLTDGTWVQFVGDIAVPDCTLANVSMWLEGPTAGELYLDHVSVRQVTSTNVINNGTFESGATGWYTWSGGTLTATNTRAHGGAQSLLVSNRTKNAPVATDVTSVVKAGASYPLSAWVSIDTKDGSTSKSLNLTQAVSCTNADGLVSTTYKWLGSKTVTNGTSWTQLSATLSVASCNVKQVQFWVEGDINADIYVDDVQLIDNGGSPSNLITDGTFESGQGAWGGWGYTTLGVVSTMAHSGQACLMGGGMQTNGALSRDITGLVSPGKKYQATAWVTVGNLAAGSGAVKFQTIQRCSGATSDSYPWLAGATIANSVWTQVTGTVDLSACSAVEKLQLFVGADSGNLYVDDVTLTAM